MASSETYRCRRGRTVWEGKATNTLLRMLSGNKLKSSHSFDNQNVQNNSEHHFGHGHHPGQSLEVGPAYLSSGHHQSQTAPCSSSGDMQAQPAADLSSGDDQADAATDSQHSMTTSMNTPPPGPTNRSDFMATQQLKRVQLYLDAERMISQIFEDTARGIQAKNDDLEELLDEQIRQNEELVASSSAPTPAKYSVMIVDGDSIQFSTQIGKSSAEEEGALTARTLRNAVKGNLAREPATGDSELTRICIYGNTGWLADSYTVDGTLPDSFSFDTFVKSFNSIDPWTEIIAVGSAQNASKDRALQMLRLHLTDERCGGIIFGGEIDEAIVDAFEEHKHIIRRIMLVDQSPITASVETPPPENRFVSNIFRSEPIVPSLESPLPVKKVEFDELGRRIDPIVLPTQAMVDRVASLTCCNNLYLKGKCTYPRCKHNHTPKLRQQELDALIFLGRNIRCRNGPRCTDEDCYAGHHCPRLSCDGFCGFEKSMHLPGTIFQEETTDLFPTKVLGLRGGLAVNEREEKRIENEGVSMHMLRRSKALNASAVPNIKQEDEGLNSWGGTSMLEQHGNVKRYTENGNENPKNSKRVRIDKSSWR